MPNVEIKSTGGLTRKQAGQRLIELGNALVGGSTVEVDWGNDKIKIGVADRVEWELEIEIEGSETELEIELKWSDAAATAEAEPPMQANPRRTRSSRAKTS